jgi:hypothetical protein
MYVKYDDDNGNRVGGKDVYVADLAFSSGSATVTIKPNANGAELTFTAGGSGAVVSGCSVRGRKVVDFGEMEAKAINQSSIVDYGRRTLRLNIPSIDNLDQAQYIADFERDRRGNPRGMVQAVTLASHGKNGGTQHANQLALTMGSRIRVKETQTAHDSNYYIIGEAHELTSGATHWKTTWYLEPTVN